MDRARMLRTGQKRFDAVTGDQYLVSTEAKGFLHKSAHRRVVLDDENRFAPHRSAHCSIGDRRGLCDLIYFWEKDLARGSQSRRAFDSDRSTALLHDTVHSGQPETRPLPFFFGGKKRLEQMRLGFFAHPM